MERRASESQAYAISSGPLLLHFCSALPSTTYILPSDGHPTFKVERNNSEHRFTFSEFWRQ